MDIVKDLTLGWHSSRHGRKISAIVLHYPAPNTHYTHPYSAEAVHKKLSDMRLSYHYYVNKSGKVYQFVPDELKAWHAGISSLHGEDNVNMFSIGVCMENNGGEDYGDPLVMAASDVCKELAFKYDVPMNRIVGHCHVSPHRKIDPGKKFPWFKFFMQMLNGKPTEPL